MKYCWNQFFPNTPLETFLTSIIGEELLHEKTDLSETSELLNWQEINQLLSGGMLTFPRIRVSKNGVVFPENEYCIEEIRRRERTLYAEPSKLHQQMMDGGVLVIDSIHEFCPQISVLAGFFSTILRETIQINCYIGGRNSAGFDLHWDDHDVFILQIHGSKEWEVRKHTRKYPMFKDIEPNLDPPDAVEWQSTLKTGEILYIPKGWWHKAFASDNLTCHLTIGVPQRTGIDYLTHLIDLCKGFEHLRKALPKPLLDEQVDARYRIKVKGLLTQAIDQVSITDYWDHHESMMKTRYGYSFPFSLVDNVIESDSVVALSFLHRPSLTTEPDVSFGVFENTWTFDCSTTRFFETLWREQEGVKVSQLMKMIDVDDVEVFQLVEDLILNGLVVKL